MSRHIVIEGNLTRDPNGGYGKDTGQAYAHLDVAVTDRTRNNQGDWVDGPVRCAAPGTVDTGRAVGRGGLISATDLLRGS